MRLRPNVMEAAGVGSLLIWIDFPNRKERCHAAMRLVGAFGQFDPGSVGCGKVLPAVASLN